MEIDMYMCIFIESAHSEQPIGPNEHNAYQCQSIETEFDGVQRNVVFELSPHLIIIIHYFGYHFIVYCTNYA